MKNGAKSADCRLLVHQCPRAGQSADCRPPGLLSPVDTSRPSENHFSRQKKLGGFDFVDLSDRVSFHFCGK